MTQVKWYYYLILLGAGMVWGATIPGVKIVMSTGLPVIGVRPEWGYLSQQASA